MGVIRFAVKSTLAGGFVYYTVQEGLWSSAEDTIKFYQKICNNITPYVKEYVSPEITKGIETVPNPTILIGCTRGIWNKGVKTSMKFISELPTHMSNGVDSLMSLPVLQDSVETVKGVESSKEAKSP